MGSQRTVRPRGTFHGWTWFTRRSNDAAKLDLLGAGKKGTGTVALRPCGCCRTTVLQSPFSRSYFWFGGEGDCARRFFTHSSVFSGSSLASFAQFSQQTKTG